MNMVALATRILEFFTKKSITRAESRNAQAIKQLKSVKGKVDKSAFELKKKQADTLIQLTRIGKLSEEIGAQSAIQEGKAERVNALLFEIED